MSFQFMELESNFTQVYYTLSEMKESIVVDWEKKVRDSIPSAQTESSPALIHHLPSIIHDLAEIFRNNGRIDEDRESNTYHLNKTHGEQRATQTRFSLEEVLKEYSLLRETIIEHLYPGVAPDLCSARIIHTFIDRAVQSTVLEFERLQNEKITGQNQNLELEKRLRQRFIAALTHDLRTPLAAAIMSAEMIQRRSETTSYQQKYLGKINHNLSRMEQMIQDFLDVTLIKSGQHMPIKFTTFSLKPLIEEIVEDLVTIHGDRFQLNCKHDIEVTMGKKSFRRIVENLANNAIKYGSQTEQVTIGLAREGEMVKLTVHNSGPVIPPRDLENLFDDFMRSDIALNSEKKGWGLGLPLVQGLVKAHQGTISVTSTADTGTTFTITLPLRQMLD